MKVVEMKMSLRPSHLRLFTRKLVINAGYGRSSGSLPVEHLPVYNSGMQIQQYKKLTATGIAPDLHRTSLLIS